MSTSKPGQPPGAVPNSYTRFIPREELGDFAAWNPTAFEPPDAAATPGDVGLRKPTLAERAAADVANRKAQAQQKAELGQTLREAAAALKQGKAPTAAPKGAGPAPQQARPAPMAGTAPAANAAAGKPKPAAKPVVRPIIGGVPGEHPKPEREPAASPPPPPAGPTPEEIEAMVREARQVAYQEGYHNGLAALESYKATQSAQMAAYMNDQVGMLAADFHHRLESLEQQLAGRIAGVALELARQVVRAELDAHPEVVVTVAEEALGTLLATARQVVLRLNPDDHALAAPQLAEVLAARGARVVPDAALSRGSCFVESDIAVVDASVEARWDRAAAALGCRSPWNDGHEPHRDDRMPLQTSIGEAMDPPEHGDAA